jgi:signal transduction histidine kinase
MPQEQQIGYLVRKRADGTEAISEIIAMPIFSSETGEVIAAIVLGFKPMAIGAPIAEAGMKSGIWFNGNLYVSPLSEKEQTRLRDEIARVIAGPGEAGGGSGSQIGEKPDKLFFKRLNPGSLFPPAYEVCIYPLTEFLTRQKTLRWQIAGAGVLLLLGGLVASHVVTQRLSAPVEKLAVDSADNFEQRQRAEAKLELTNEELQRAARFSADASHQLKTPVTVLRAGLEELLAQENLTPEECHEISALIHQTYRLSSVIEDLLLLSRMDAGRLKIEFSTVNLSQLIEASLDDLGALPNDEMNLAITTDFPPQLEVAGEKRYLSLILQNLLENARKYNHRGGRIHIAARLTGGVASLTVGNTGRPIAPATQDRIFERFHRGAMGENVPGYGLGLNLARELARLHQGDVRLVRSDETWTEFEVRLGLALPARVAAQVS